MRLYVTQPTVCIVESLHFLEEQTHREGEIISRTLQLSRKPTAYVYIRTVDELRAVAQEFGNSDHRYLHLSFHGLVNMNDKMVGLGLPVGEILNEGALAPAFVVLRYHSGAHRMSPPDLS